MRIKIILSISLVASLGFIWILTREIGRISEQGVTSWTTDPTADCGVVLTGGPNRIRVGIDLLSQKAIKKLIISGVNPSSQLREIFPQWPYYGDLDEQDVILERRSSTTYGNAQQSVALLEALHCRGIVLITSTLHSYRAVRTFRNNLPHDYPIHTYAVLAGPSVMPSPMSVLIESFKSIFYSLWAY
jgi:uncharacterized SAM-binding protein YcdF (DUF218 family)